MRLDEVRNIAKSRGVHPDSLTKTKLIRTLQLVEGNFDCFATASNFECDRMDCCWREDCFDAVRKGELS
ncbi:MAG: SAP domain-containing protein [Nitrosomonadales bacterium]|nr:SAP domain-containing protein [Nitrosomonadales bacterium]